MNKTKKLVSAAVLTALLVVMAFTPLGYLKIGIFSITFLSIPVAVGAVLLGEWYGLFLGAVFGLSSFAQCFGLDAFGTVLFGINPFGMFITTFITRALMGFLTGLIYKVLSVKHKKSIGAITVTTLSASLLNTLLFTLSFLLFFAKSDLSANADALGGSLIDFSSMTLWQVVVFIVAFNPILEIPVCGFVGTLISKALVALMPRINGGRK